MMPKIYWCVVVGSVFWLHNDELMHTPMNNDSTADLSEGGAAEEWSESPVTEAHVRAKLGAA